MDEISKSIYIGDSKYDYLAAERMGIDFVFLSKWSEFKDIENYSNNHNILCLKSLRTSFRAKFNSVAKLLITETKINLK